MKEADACGRLRSLALERCCFRHFYPSVWEIWEGEAQLLPSAKSAFCCESLLWPPFTEFCGRNTWGPGQNFQIQVCRSLRIDRPSGLWQRPSSRLYHHRSQSCVLKEKMLLFLGHRGPESGSPDSFESLFSRSQSGPSSKKATEPAYWTLGSESRYTR